MTENEKLFERILNEFNAPLSDCNEERFEMTEVVDQKDEPVYDVVDDFIAFTQNKKF